MRRAILPKLILFLLLAVLLTVGIIFIVRLLTPEVDPHAGQVYLYDGFDWVWYTPLEGVEPNPWTAEDFESVGGRPMYRNSDYLVQTGIDVSEHQRSIDWPRVAAAGVDYAYIRLGRRGYTEGGLFEDPWFSNNMRGAAESGLQVGVYFFSQAINVQEAIEEANFVLERLRGRRVDLPVVYDWEKIEDENARTRDLSAQTRTDCAVAFCETIRQGGFEPAVYFNRTLGYYGYDLTRLTDYEFWFALPEAAFPSFYYKVDSWQFSFSEKLPGIDPEILTDMNLRFIPAPPAEETAPAETPAAA